jgi:CHAD domain-containing protein
MAQSTRPASANGSARQDTRAAGRPARSSADGAVRSLAGAKASSPGNGAARAEPAPALHTGLEAVAATWFGEIWSRAHRLGEGRAAVADAGPDLIHDLRIYVRRLCALSDLLPRPPGARPMRRALRKEVAWAMQPLSRARDWDVFTMEVLPQLCDADPDIDPQASAARARARSEIAHDEMYANLQTERFQAMLRLLRERSAEIPAAMAERAPRSLYRALGRRLEGWDAALRARLDNAADQGPRRQHAARIRVKRLRYASEALLLLSPSRKLERYVKALADVQGALGSAQDFRTAAALGRDVCVSLSTGRLAGRQGDKAALRLLRRAGDGLRSASRRLLRRPSFWAQASRGRVARRLGPAGAEAPRATA